MKRKELILALGILLMSFSCALPDITAFLPTKETTLTPESSPTIESTGSIKGILWHDICEFTGGEAGQPVVLGRGCVQWGTGADEFGPNQTQDDFESGWAGVTIHLGMGSCPSTGLATAITDSLGYYEFTGLEPRVYCVVYSSLNDKNDVILIPGGPTFPARGVEGFYSNIDLLPGEEKTVNFGYAWQFYN